jgi:hypothetical protein
VFGKVPKQCVILSCSISEIIWWMALKISTEFSSEIISRMTPNAWRMVRQSSLFSL